MAGESGGVDINKQIKDAIGESAHLYTTVGFYLACFGAADLQLSRILAHILGFTNSEMNFEKFDFLAGELELSRKIKTLKKASKVYQLPMGLNIKSRIDSFDNECRLVRNKLAHSDLSLQAGQIVCSSLGTHLHGHHETVRPSGHQPTRFSLDQLNSQSLWLIAFRSDLEECAISTWTRETPFDVANPKTEPKAPKLI